MEHQDDDHCKYIDTSKEKLDSKEITQKIDEIKNPKLQRKREAAQKIVDDIYQKVNK